MNGRLYDPLLHRFLAPDNYVQDPYNTQNFNRYGYVLNNPLLYTDESGEFLWLAIPIFAGINLLGNLVRNDFKMNFGQILGSLAQGAVQGALFAATAGASVTWGSALINAGLSQFPIPAISIPLGPNASFSISAAFAYGTGGLSMGISGGLNYASGDFSFSVSAGIRTSGTILGGGFSYFDRKNNQYFSAGFTAFGGKDPQNNWFAGYKRGDFSFSMTNDAWVGGDKYRTAAAEIGIGDYSFGFNLYTTEPNKSEYKSKPHVGDNPDYVSPIWGRNSYDKYGNYKGTYKTGSRVFAGMYLGYKHGGQSYRIGFDGGFVQDLFQNGIHRHIVKGPYFNTHLNATNRLFFQHFSNNPFSLYSH